MKWLFEWLRVGDVKKPFPREFSLSRRVVYDYSAVKENGVDEYMSIFSLWQRRLGWYDVILIDIDGEDAYWKYKEVRKMVLGSYGIEPSVVYFSGRGFHLYFWFDGFVFNDYGETIRKFVKIIGLNEFVDNHVVGDKSRMARIPHTYNSKSGLWVMKVNPSWVWAEIKGKSRMHDEYDVAWVKNEELSKILLELDDGFEGKKYDYEFDGEEVNNSIVDEYFVNGDKFPPCVESWKKEIEKTGELDHIERLNLAIFLLHVWGYKKTLEYFRKYASDFKEQYTVYQLRYIMKRKLKMHSCNRLKEFGLCPMEGRNCPFYPTLNAWVRWK